MANSTGSVSTTTPVFSGDQDGTRPASFAKFPTWALPLLTLLLVIAALVMALNLPTPLKIQFNSQNIEEYQQSGFFGPETDADGNRYRWTNGQASLTLSLSARHPVKLNLSLRNAAVVGGPQQATQVKANGAIVGTLEPKVDGAKFQNYSLEFQPTYPATDSETLRLELVTPNFKPSGDDRRLGVMVASIELDATPVWEPYTRRASQLDQGLAVGLAIGLLGLLFWGQRPAGWIALPLGALLAAALYEQSDKGLILPAIALFVSLGIVFWLFSSRSLFSGSSALSLTGSLLAFFGCLVVILLLVARLVLLGLMGYPGSHYLAGPSFLAFFATTAICVVGFIGLMLFYLPLPARKASELSNLNLYDKLSQLARPLVTRYPNLSLLLYFGLANLALVGIAYAQQMIVHGSLENLLRHWDSPSYLINAVTLYDQNQPILNVPTFSKTYWLSSFPAYSVLVRVLSYPIGYLPALLVGNLLVAPLWAFVLYRLLRDFGYATKPLWITSLALVLPERWLSDRIIASSEPITMLGLTACFYFFKKRQYTFAGLAGSVAVLSRPNGVFFYGGLLLALAWEAYQYIKEHEVAPSGWLRTFQWGAALKLSLMPLTLLLLYGFMGLRTGDMLAYFHISDGGAPTRYYGLTVPFSGLYQEPGQEGQFYIYLLPLLGLAVSWKRRYYDLFWAGLSVYGFTVFLIHFDLARYMLPAIPFTVILPFANWIERKELRPVWLIACVLAYFFTFYLLDSSGMERDLWRRLIEYLPR